MLYVVFPFHCFLVITVLTLYQIKTRAAKRSQSRVRNVAYIFDLLSSIMWKKEFIFYCFKGLEFTELRLMNFQNYKPSLFSKTDSLNNKTSLALDTLHKIHYTLHSTLYTLHSTLYTLHSTLCTLHSTLYTLHSTLYTLHSALYTLHSTLCTLYSNFNSIYCLGSLMLRYDHLYPCIVESF